MSSSPTATDPPFEQLVALARILIVQKRQLSADEYPPLVALVQAELNRLSNTTRHGPETSTLPALLNLRCFVSKNPQLDDFTRRNLQAQQMNLWAVHAAGTVALSKTHRYAFCVLVGRLAYFHVFGVPPVDPPEPA